MDRDEHHLVASIAKLLARQDGLVSRPQLIALEIKDSDIARMLRRRELVRVHKGRVRQPHR